MNAAILNALAEPHRVQMIELLRKGQLTVGEIAEQLSLRQPQASKHLKVLSEAKLVEVQADANRRIYRLCPKPLMELDEWLNSFRGLWEGKFDRLSDYLLHLKKSGSIHLKEEL